MREEEKSELIQLWLALAEEKLEVAHELLDLCRLDDAVSKAYVEPERALIFRSPRFE